MTASYFSSNRFSVMESAEPLLWCCCLGIAVMHTALLHGNDTPSHNKEDAAEDSPPAIPLEALLSLLLMGVITCRACFLVVLPQISKTSLWRMPSNTKRQGGLKDEGGMFMSLLLIPLLYWAIGNYMTLRQQQQNNDGTSKIWYHYSLFISLSSYVAWEDSLWRQQQESRQKLLFAVVLGMITLPLTWMAHASGNGAAILVLVILWQGIYYSMQDFLPTSFHGVFTQGEWMVVTSLVAIALTQYCLYRINGYFADHNDSGSSSCDTEHTLLHSAPNNSHATIAMSGLIATAVTCPIMTAINNKWIVQSGGNRHNDKQASSHKEIIALLLQLPLWVGIPLGGVELLEFWQTGAITKDSSYLEDNQQSSSQIKLLLEYHIIDKSGDSIAQPTTLLSTFLSTMMEKWDNVPKECIPKSIQWLVDFLMETEQPLVATMSLPLISRFGWLVYWLIILAIAIPFAPEPPQDNTDNKTNNTQAIVVARKWFHGVAVVLFGPVTLAAPQLLSLAYAIALAILMLLESARTAFPMIQQFHQQYLDPSKDAANGLVISHMALIVGCALPLWISELIVQNHNGELPKESIVLLQLWGVLSLGVGDAMGAIVGVWKGRTRWSQYNSRTLEGSLAMWISLLLSCFFVYWYCDGDSPARFGWQSIVTATLVTLLEAHTSQIDNLVLPLVGAALLLILQS